MRARPLALIAALGLTVSLAACSAGPDASESPAAATDEGSWTVLTYSIADTNLEPFMMTDLEEIGDVGSQKGLNLIALVDRSDEYSEDPVLGLNDWSGAKLLQIGKNEATVLEDMGDVNTGDPNVLADFIARGISSYPADHYALIISDHGASWPGVGADGSFDDDGLSLREIDEALAAGLEAVDVEKFDMLGFDACLMATYEVASTLAPRADRLVASQELEPGHGWDYTALDVIADDGQATVDELGSAIIDGFHKQANDEGTDAEITLAEIDLTKMGAVDEALTAFTDVLIDAAATVGPTVGRTLADTLGFGQSPDPSQDTHMKDLAIFTSEIGVQLLFASDAADNLTRAINDVVLDRVDGQATRGATGLSIYFPDSEDYFDQDYTTLQDRGGWLEFLTAYYGSAAAISQPPVVDQNAEITFGDDGVTITGFFDPTTAANLSEAYIRYGVYEEDGSLTFLGEEEADLAPGNSGSASGTYDLTYLTLYDGYDTATAYLSLYNDEDTGTSSADIPLSYYAPDDSASGDLLLDVIIEDGEITSETYYEFDDEAGTYGEFAPEADWIIVPTVLNVLPDGTEQWLETSDVGLYADLESLVYQFEDLEPETQLYLELVVVDFGGNYASVHAVVTVP